MGARWWIPTLDGGRKLAAVAALVAISRWAAPAHAQEDEAVLQKLVELNRKALIQYEAKNFEAAKSTLLEAVVVGKEAGLGNHNMMARTYLHMGVVHVQGLKDRQKGLRYFSLALRIRSDIKLTPSLVTPTLTEAFQAAQREGGDDPKPEATPAVSTAPAAELSEKPKSAPDFSSAGSESKSPEAKKSEPVDKAPPPAAPAAKSEPAKAAEPVKPAEPVKAREPETAAKASEPEEPDLPARIPGPLHCPNPDEAPPEQEIALRCVTQPGLAVTRVILFYRAPGGETFTAVRAIRSPKGWYNAAIPSKQVVGKSLQYYFEARDRTGRVAGNSGRGDSPNLMMIRAGAPPIAKGALAGLRFSTGEASEAAVEENPLQAMENARQTAQEPEFVGRAGSFWFSMGIGSGYGWHPTKVLEYRQDLEVKSGLHPSGLLHLAPEVGYFLRHDLAVSIQGRHQFIPVKGSGDQRAGSPKSSAHALLARLLYFFGGGGKSQFYFSGVLGGGQGFRLVVPPKPDRNLERSDTVRGGPWVVGSGVGFMYHFTPRLTYLAEVRGLVGAPTLAAVIDASTGVQIAF